MNDFSSAKTGPSLLTAMPPAIDVTAQPVARPCRCRRGPDESLVVVSARPRCTDLHAENVLCSQREPWLVIDPKPYVGDPAYEPARLQTGPVHAQLRSGSRDRRARRSSVAPRPVDAGPARRPAP
ncbi:MAG: aminoglycoside phosphotransferase family protein [Solirubrobacteraceae bacterium]